jgi:orotate phosphoribosyltransferase-like protein
MVAVPAVSQRIIGGKATVIVGRQLADHITRLSKLLSFTIEILEKNNFNNANLYDLSRDISTAWDSTFGDASQIRAIADDVHDIDLENELSGIIQTGLQVKDAGLPVILLFRRLLDAEHVQESLGTSLYGTTSANLAIINIIKSLGDIRNFVEVCRSKLNDLEEIDGRLVHMVQGAKETRLNLLQIIGTPRSQTD